MRLTVGACVDIDMTFRSQLNEEKRQQALQDARNKEFDNVLTLLKKILPPPRKGLEVGCSYGWFIEKASGLYEVEGIEAEDTVAQKARDKGLRVHTGLFPQDLPPECGKYDFIIFNNVWEHINHTTELIDGCVKYLKKGGCLIITIPLSTGAIYKISEWLERFGRVKELARLWQLHFHSPHIYYFNKKNIEQLMSKKGFKLVECKDIRSIDVNKMKERFEMDAEERHGGRKAAIFKLIYPVLKRMPADKAVFFFRT